MKTKTIFLTRLAVVAIGVASLASCEKTGVCTACCGPSGVTYCKDNWTEAECKEWNDLGVNGLDWFWHEDQTCESRGTPATP